MALQGTAGLKGFVLSHVGEGRWRCPWLGKQNTHYYYFFVIQVCFLICNIFLLSQHCTFFSLDEAHLPGKAWFPHPLAFCSQPLPQPPAAAESFQKPVEVSGSHLAAAQQTQITCILKFKRVGCLQAVLSGRGLRTKHRDHARRVTTCLHDR